MTDEKHEKQGGRHAEDLRRDRLKLKLRENLKRRKSQAKERDRRTAASSPGHQAPPDGEAGKRDK